MAPGDGADALPPPPPLEADKTYPGSSGTPAPAPAGADIAGTNRQHKKTAAKRRMRVLRARAGCARKETRVSVALQVVPYGQQAYSGPASSRSWCAAAAAYMRGAASFLRGPDGVVVWRRASAVSCSQPSGVGCGFSQVVAPLLSSRQ